MRKRRAFHVQTLLLFFQVSDDKCEIKFFNRLILEKNRFLEKLFRRNGYFFFFFFAEGIRLRATVRGLIELIELRAPCKYFLYRMDRRTVENVSFFMRKGRALDTVCKLSNALGL